MEMELDPAAAHYRQRLQEAEDNTAIMAMRLRAAHNRIQQLEDQLKDQPELPMQE